MLGEFIVNSLVLVLGYAYPAFECFKCVENNRVQIEELRFWCQYWIVVGLVRVLESVADIFISWIPMYSEVKLALFIYLWYPKSKGTEYIYGALLKPFVSEHEGEIERSFMEFKGRAWELVVYYWQNCTELGQAKFFQMLDFLATGRLTQSTSKQKDTDHRHGGAPLPPPAPAATKSGPFRRHR
ncbi:putative HVA22-like protein g [Ipomoea triloba]|uniref:putative HVA22-like protein g n=1 Tax=Ipomoea triloba TaxID=35885 RepID=UPI00125D3FEF|nr:putative HVA22-like protein g [Ipomoea triloba]GMD39638.1 putative HVA22-like protein G [Ipomoea batatas]